MNLRRRIIALFRRSPLDREINEEPQVHLDMLTLDNIAAGMSPEAAARDARLRFGNPAATRERIKHIDAALAPDSLWRDVRYAIRSYWFGSRPTATRLRLLALDPSRHRWVSFSLSPA